MCKIWNEFYYIILNLTGWTGLSGLSGLSGYFFCLHQFPEEIDKTQSTLGGKKCFRLTIDFYLISVPRNFGDLMLIVTYPAEGDRVFFVSSGNKE